jgi:hypothetical protein
MWVKDVITYALYVPGGIRPPKSADHPPKPADRKKHRALNDAAAAVSFTSFPAGLSALLAIGRVGAEGPSPLRAEVAARVD